MAGEWRKVPVSEIATAVIGGTPSRSVTEYWHGRIPWATARNVASVSGRYLNQVQEFITEDGLEHSATKLMPRGTVIITARGTVGALAQLGREMAFNQTCYALLPDDGLDNNFLFYALKGTMAHMQALTYGTVFETITIKTFDHWLVPLAPLPEQRAIAHILGALDDKIELNRRMNETLEAIAQAIFKSWFLDAAEDGLPESWRVISMPEAVEINPPRSLQKGEVAPYVDMQNMPTRGHRPLGWIDREFGSGMRFINGDTLLARITPCLENGKTAFVDWLADGQVGWGSTEYIIMRPKPPLPPEYGYYLARSEELRAHAIQNMTGSSGRQRVQQASFAQFEVAISPEPVARRFGEIAKQLMGLIRANDEQSRTLAALRDTLLPKLISGKLRVKDAESLVNQSV